MLNLLELVIELDWIDSVKSESLSDKNTLWQIEELLLILFVSGRFHNIDDILLLSEIFEKLFPDSAVIGFKGNRTFLIRQLELGKKNGKLISSGTYFGISAEGRTFVLEIINEKISKNEIELFLNIPIVLLKGSNVGIARNISGHWRLIGFGEIV